MSSSPVNHKAENGDFRQGKFAVFLWKTKVKKKQLYLLHEKKIVLLQKTILNKTLTIKIYG